MYKLPPLNYDYDALNSYISADIMKLHHMKHHQTYVDKLNAALSDAGETNDRPLIDLLTNLESLPETVRTAVRNHGGGHYNHSLFWNMMSPDGGSEPSGEVAQAIIKKYGSYQQFVDKFSAQALAVFGSGWMWLLPDMSITTTANQDTPLSDGGTAPLLGLDVWEHAYYLDYTYNRADYVKAWWNTVNWNYVEQRHSGAVTDSDLVLM